MEGNEQNTIQSGINAAKANAQSAEEQQQLEQLASELQSGATNASGNENDEQSSRQFPGVQ